MAKYDFKANVQSKDSANDRKTIELSPAIRDKLNVKDHVRVTVKKKGNDSVNFYANIQAKSTNRKLIELPPSIRDDFKVGDNLKITIECT